MLGFDAVGRLALGQIPGGGVTNHTLTVTANVDAAATVRKAVSNFARAAADATATVSKPFNKLLSLLAAVDAGVSVRRSIAKRLNASADAGASVSRAITHSAAAMVDAAVSVIKAVVKQPFVAAVGATALAIKGTGKVLSAAVSFFAAIIFEAQNIVSRRVLHDPVDYYMAKLPQYREVGDTYEPSRGKASESVSVSRSKRGRLSKNAPSFTTRTDKRGYD